MIEVNKKEDDKVKRFSPPMLLSSLCLISVIAVQGPLSCVFASQNQVGKTPLEKFYEKHGRDWAITFSGRPLRVTGLVGNRTEPYSGKPSAMATQFLKENPELFGLNPDLKDLVLVAERTTGFGINVAFQQVLEGLPVENGRIKINFDKQGRVVQVVSSYTPITRPVKRALIEREQARNRAFTAFLNLTLIYTSKSTEQKELHGTRTARADMELVTTSVDDVYFIVRGRARRAYKVLISARNPLGLKELVIDANTGAVLQTRDLISTAVDGRGRVFIPNPVNSLNNDTFRDSGDDDSAVPLPSASPNPYSMVTLPWLDDPVYGSYTLRGKFVALHDIEPPTIVPISESSPDFTYLRSADAFEEVMIYYHLNRIHSYIWDLGFTDVLTEQLKVDAHGDHGYDNSRYVPTPNNFGEPYLVFGCDGVDDAEDADIIAHEYAHAIQDNQAPAKYAIEGQPKAMSEGFGDYWAFTIYSTETQTSQHRRGCIGEWDKVPNCLRNVETQSYANQYNPSDTPHRNGRIWSRILVDIFDALTKQVADPLILQSHFNVSSGPSFAQGADAILAADWQLYQGAHQAELCAIFDGRLVYSAAGLPSCRFTPDRNDASRRYSSRRR